MKTKSKPRKPARCALCEKSVLKRGQLCRNHDKILKLGIRMQDQGFETRVRTEKHFDNFGMAVAMSIFDPMLKLSAPHMPKPKAVCINGTWYARLDAGHLLQVALEAEWQELGR